jgi:hypothetical protein
MQPRALFGVAVRIAGLVFLAFSLFDLAYAALKWLGLPTPSSLPVTTDLTAGVMYLAIALFALLRADLLVNLTYGLDDNDHR